MKHWDTSKLGSNFGIIIDSTGVGIINEKAAAKAAIAKLALPFFGLALALFFGLAAWDSSPAAACAALAVCAFRAKCFS